ncbi:PIN domain-containing protein [Rheinheimera sp.]|uniref:PIN domain-containing protein n=1 Tax=Rheinheimera sp. TaxID=1869214 RepID=UPI00307E5A19
MTATKEETCILIVDANILVQDFWLEGFVWGYLVKRNFLSHKLAVPRIALEEAAANIERRARDLLQRMSQAGVTTRLESQYQLLFNRKKVGKESPAKLGKRYKDHMLAFLKTHGGIIVEPPDVPLSLLLQRSIERRKPFNSGDKGFLDTLIWLNTLDVVKDYKRVSFVSSNTADYAQGDNLHPDLEQDLIPVLPKHLHFRYFKNLNEFIAFIDRDGEAGAEALRNALMSDGYSGFKLDSWIRENIDDLLSQNDLDGIEWTALPYWAEDPRLIELEDLVGIEIHNERALGIDRVELLCDLALVGIFQCSILFSSWKNIIHPCQVQWIDDESSDMWTEVGVRSVGTFLIRIVFDLNLATIVEHDVVPIAHNVNEAIASLEEIRYEAEENG